jgi:hypothetical protein
MNTHSQWHITVIAPLSRPGECKCFQVLCHYGLFLERGYPCSDLTESIANSATDQLLGQEEKNHHLNGHGKDHSVIESTMWK